MEKILLAVDGSAHSLRAAEYAVKLMSRGHAPELHLVHVEEAVPMRSHAFMNQDEIHALYEKEAGQRCHEVRAKLDAGAIPYVWHLEVGEPGATIVRVAQALGVATIILGTRGQNTVANLLLGSVVTKVIHDAPMPVTIVK